MCYINQTQQAQLGNMVSKAYMIQSCQLYIMGKAIVSQPQLPLPAVLIVRQQTLSPPKPSSLTPFSAVAPPRSVAVSNCRPQKTTILLETIYEETTKANAWRHLRLLHQHRSQLRRSPRVSWKYGSHCRRRTLTTASVRRKIYETLLSMLCWKLYYVGKTYIYIYIIYVF